MRENFIGQSKNIRTSTATFTTNLISKQVTFWGTYYQMLGVTTKLEIHTIQEHEAMI